MAVHVLVADDDTSLAEGISWYLGAEGMRCTIVGDGPSALAAAREDPPDVVVLDIMMPGLDGYGVCEALRASGAVPVLMLSARDTELDKVRAFDLGADDYVTKPFSAMELVARIKALLRRAGAAPTLPTLESGALRVRLEEREVWCGDASAPLTRTEFDLLVALMRHAPRVLSRDRLVEIVWGDDFYGDLRLIDSHIYHLRDKLRDAGLDPTPISTIRGVGYAFRPAP